MISIKEAKHLLEQLKTKNKFEKMVRVSAILTDLLDKHRIKPIIVGGLAVEIYTRSEYTTVDIDLILSRRDLANEILLELGFTKVGRHWYHEELLISIEIPSDILQDADYERIIELQLPGSGRVYVIGIEDIILDRLRACIHWKSTADCEWGRRLYLLHKERLDIEYIKETAIKDMTFDQFKSWLNQTDL